MLPEGFRVLPENTCSWVDLESSQTLSFFWQQLEFSLAKHVVVPGVMEWCLLNCAKLWPLQQDFIYSKKALSALFAYSEWFPNRQIASNFLSKALKAPFAPVKHWISHCSNAWLIPMLAVLMITFQSTAEASVLHYVTQGQGRRLVNCYISTGKFWLTSNASK